VTTSVITELRAAAHAEAVILRASSKTGSSRSARPMKRHLAFDIGCIECGEPSAVLGVFMSRDEANLAAEHAERVQRENWRGQHYFEVYEIEVPS